MMRNHTHETKVKTCDHDRFLWGVVQWNCFNCNQVDILGPERWWTILELVEVEGNSDGRP